MKLSKTVFSVFAFAVVAGRAISCVAAEPLPPMTFPPDVAAQPGAEMAVSLKIADASGKKKTVKLLTSEGRSVNYGDFTRQSYVEAVDSAPGIVPAIRPGSLQTGLSIYAVPGHLNSHGQVPVRFKVEDSELESLGNITVNGATIELPNIQTAALDQTVLMRSGEPVHLDLLHKDGKVTSIVAEIVFTVPVNVSDASVAETAAYAITQGSPCSTNGLISYSGGLMYCDGGKWTAQDASALQRQAAMLPESLFGGAFKKPGHPSSVMATTN